QVRPYLLLAEYDKSMADMIRGVIQKQMELITHDSYANAFNETTNSSRFNDDETKMTPLVWERKYEIDSLCYPIQLAYLFWKTTGRIDHFNDTFKKAIKEVIDTWIVEQNHVDSEYHFVRYNCEPQDTLSHDGYGAPVGYTGMTWSGFRPSDDACKYGYLVPSNMFVVVVLDYLQEISKEVLKDKDLAQNTYQLRNKINQGIQDYGTVQHPKFGKIYAYETDGLGNHVLMDDANVPSLLSIPYLGYCGAEDTV